MTPETTPSPTPKGEQHREIEVLRTIFVGTAFLVAVGAMGFVLIAPLLPGGHKAAVTTESTAIAALRDCILLGFGALSTAAGSAIRQARSNGDGS